MRYGALSRVPEIVRGPVAARAIRGTNATTPTSTARSTKDRRRRRRGFMPTSFRTWHSKNVPEKGHTGTPHTNRTTKRIPKEDTGGTQARRNARRPETERIITSGEDTGEGYGADFTVRNGILA